MRELPECIFESEVCTLATHADWLAGAPAELRQHVSTCELCSVTAIVAVAVASDRDDVRASISVPSPDKVWWLTRLRARRESIEASRKPILAAESVAFVCAAAVAVLILFFALGVISVQPLLAGAWQMLTSHALLAASMVVTLIGVPVAVYLAAGRD